MAELTVGSFTYVPGTVRSEDLHPGVAAHRDAVANEITDRAGYRVLDILAVTMHRADFVYNVTAELVNDLVAFAQHVDETEAQDNE